MRATGQLADLRLEFSTMTTSIDVENHALLSDLSE